MSIKQYPGGIVTKNPTAPTTSSAKGIWTLDQAQNYTKQGIWPRSPGAPTIGAITQSSSTAANVAFTAPSDTGSNAITGYIATSTPGSLTGSGASSPVVVSGLTTGTSYTFKVKATNGAGTGPESAASSSFTPVQTCATYTSPGSYTWVAPSCVTSVSVVAVGAGTGGSGAPSCCGGSSPGGAGGGLGYINNYAVTPGSSYSVVVGAAQSYGSGTRGSSYFVNSSTVQGQGSSNNNYGGRFPTCTGGNGGQGGSGSCLLGGGGGGAGGYSGAGGTGGAAGGYNGNSGSGGAAGGGWGSSTQGRGGQGGGGVGLFGQGSNGSGGSSSCGAGGGSGGSAGGAGSGVSGKNGGSYGGGGGAYSQGPGGGGSAGAGSGGAVRIIWPGTTRSFPSTNVS